MYILLYTRTAFVLVVDAHNEVSGINTVGIIRTMIRVNITGACFAIPASPPTTLKSWLTGPAVGLARSARINTCA